jgi:hypothetical protein
MAGFDVPTMGPWGRGGGQWSIIDLEKKVAKLAPVSLRKNVFEAPGHFL